MNEGSEQYLDTSSCSRRFKDIMNGSEPDFLDTGSPTESPLIRHNTTEQSKQETEELMGEEEQESIDGLKLKFT